MQQLCKKAEKEKFSPSPASLKSPHPEKLFNLIEMGGGYDEVSKEIGQRSPDKIISQGVTPMMMAALVGNWAAASALISKGADVNFKRPPEITTTPLELSIFSRKFIFACKLMENGAKIPRSKNDRQALLRDSLITLPSEMEDGAIFVDFLIENGLNANDMGSTLETPLMRAVGVGSIPAIQVLLSHGARLDITKHNGLTVWDVAKKKNNPEVVNLLMAAQKKQNSAGGGRGKFRSEK
jgi:ankyrin repeat protein